MFHLAFVQKKILDDTTRKYKAFIFWESEAPSKKEK